MEEKSDNKTWNQELAEWYNQFVANGGKYREIFLKTGIPNQTWSDYTHGKIRNLNRIGKRRKRQIYELTGLPNFKTNLDEEVVKSGIQYKDKNINAKIFRAEEAFYRLGAALEELREYPGARIELSKIISQPDVGRLTAYLSSMYRDNEAAIPYIPKLATERRK